MHQNIAGLLNKSDLLSVHVQELLLKKIDLDVICITEHFVIAGHENLIDIPNFKMAACYARKTQKRGGSCILIKNIYEYKELKIISGFSVAGVIECCAVELIKQKTIIICIYRPPNWSNISLFYDNLDALLKTVCTSSNKKVVLCGDFNIDIIKRNRFTLDFESLLLNYNLKLEINQPTRLMSKSCLDNIAHNSKQKCHSEIMDLALSDHTAQLLKIPVKKTCIINSWRIRKRKFTKENMLKFKNYLKCLTFADVFETENANEAYDYFIDIFCLLYNLCFPLKWVIVKPDKKIKWISRGIRICSRKQRNLLWKYRRSPTQTNKFIFKTYSHRLKKIIRLTQKAQNNYVINSSENKSKAAWQIINNNKFTKDPLLQINRHNSLIKDPQEIAESFNNFFIDQVQDVASGNSKLEKRISIANNPNSIFMPPVIPQDISRAIKSLKNTKSHGYDEITTSVVKFVAEIIAIPLSHVLNTSISSGTFPSNLKKVIIKPIHKKNSKEDMANYRPVALISVFSKVFEKIIYETVDKFLTKNNILCDEQKGFRKQKNINMAIYDLLDNVMPCVDHKTPVCAIYTDMTKAFDYVSHDALINKLYAYGIRGNVLSLIKSYLTNRKQCTEISRICVKTKKELKHLSSYREVKYGVPQGSVLGPPLFILYINDLPRYTQQPMVLFADDSTAIVKCSNKDKYETDINNTLKRIINWLNKNNLIVNLQKTQIMHFHQRLSTEHYDVEFNGQKVDSTNVTKFLGIIIDNKLTWKPHSEEVCKKLSKSAYVLYNLSKKVNIRTVLEAYHGLVVSVLRFGAIFWGNCTERERIFKAQKRCIRSMTGLNNTDSCEPVFKSLKLLTFPSLYIFEVAIFVRTNLHLFTLMDNIRKRPGTVRSQYKNIMFTGRHKTALLRKSILSMGPVIYNKIPPTIKDQSLSIFKKRLTSLLINKCYYSIQDFLTDKSI